jgi:protein-tyrosine phosphatase
MDDRSLGLANATNARDLGGYLTVGGWRVRRGVLYRANALNRLTDDDIETLGRLSLACVIDFRHAHEIELIGPDRFPSTPPGRLVSLPLFDPGHDVFTTVSAMLTGRAGDQPAVLGRDGLAASAMLELYRWFVTSPMAREAFATALRLIATPGRLPLLFHCTAGKDRTGWLAALVLSVLGVDREIVTDDYLRTNEHNAPGTAYILASVADRLEDPAILVPLLEARREYLETGLAEIDRRYGDLGGYLREGLGLDDETLAALRTNLLDPPSDASRVVGQVAPDSGG